MVMDFDGAVTGDSETHLQVFHGEVKMHAEVVEPFTALVERAAQAGFELAVISGFRSRQRQVEIWNGKLSGTRPIYNEFGEVVELAALSPWQQVQAVLRFSALPGASRHHWGSDIDVFDRASLPPGYQLQLSPAEVEDGGIFGPLHGWLDVELQSASGFYRPYAEDRGGVAAERWHLSYAPVAERYEKLLTIERLADSVASSKMLLADTVLEHLDEIYQRYVLCAGM